MEILENGILLSIEEFDDLNHEIEYQKETTELFQAENKVLKAELYSLAPRVQRAEQIQKELEQILKEKTETPTKGVVSSE